MNTRKSAPLHKAHMVYHRDGHDLAQTIHFEAPRRRTLNAWGDMTRTETLCGEPLGRVCGIPLGTKTGLRGEVTCPACLEALEDGSDL